MWGRGWHAVLSFHRVGPKDSTQTVKLAPCSFVIGSCFNSFATQCCRLNICTWPVRKLSFKSAEVTSTRGECSLRPTSPRLRSVITLPPQGGEGPSLTSWLATRGCRKQFWENCVWRYSFLDFCQFLFITGLRDKHYVLRYLITLCKAMLDNFIECCHYLFC